MKATKCALIYRKKRKNMTHFMEKDDSLTKMAEEHKEGVGEKVEVSDRGLFDFMGKKEEKNQEEVVVTEMEKLSVEEEGIERKEEGEKKEGLLHKLHRSHSSSSSSSSEEEVEGPDGQKIKKKKGLKEKIKEKLGGDKKEEEVATVVVTEEVIVEPPVAGQAEDTTVVVEKIEETVKIEDTPDEEKKGFLEKIKEKLPGHGHKKVTGTDTAAATTTPLAAEEVVEEGEGKDGKEKKGILGKIMDKLPGYHKDEKESH